MKKIFDMVGVFVLAVVAGGAGGAVLLFLTQYSQCEKNWDWTCVIERSDKVLFGKSNVKSDASGKTCLNSKDSKIIWEHVMLLTGGRAEDELDFRSAWKKMDMDIECKTTDYVLSEVCHSMSIPGGLKLTKDYCDKIRKSR